MTGERQERIVRAQAAVDCWRGFFPEDIQDEEDARDLISDLCHLLAYDGVEPDHELEIALMHYEHETALEKEM